MWRNDMEDFTSGNALNYDKFGVDEEDMNDDLDKFILNAFTDEYSVPLFLDPVDLNHYGHVEG